MPYVDPGYFLDDYINENLVVRSLGDDGGVRRRFWRSKADEWLQDRLEAMQEAVEGTAKARKRVARTTEAQAAFKAVEWPEIVPHIDILERLADRLAKPQVDRAALDAAIQAQIVAANDRARKARRARDEAAILWLLG